MARSKVPEYPQATCDFYKSNGGDYRVYNDLPSMCRQEFAEECDINTIMARYERTGVMPAINGAPQFYADFTEIPGDLMSTLERFDEAERAFMQLPAVVRREFENNPHHFVEYAQDPANVDQMRAWGLAKPAAAPARPAPAPAIAAAIVGAPPLASPPGEAPKPV
jgi:hypothetical protein